MGYALFLKIFCVICVSLFSADLVFAGLDAPHDAGHKISCSSCHDTSLSDSPLLIGSNINNFCTVNCHNAANVESYSNTSAPMVLGHTSAYTSTQFGPWTKQCLDCHDPHYQNQKYWASTESVELFLFSGQVDAYVYDADDNTSALTYSGGTFKSGWNIDSITEKTTAARRPILLPNLKKTGNAFAVTAIDATTMTVAGDVRAMYTYISPPTNFGVIYGQYIRKFVDTDGDGSYEKALKFMDKNGTYGFTAGDGSNVCEICHTQTDHFRNAGAAAAPDPNHANIALLDEANVNLESEEQCLFCHNHADGFRPSCTDCHGLPPSQDSPNGPSGLVGSGNVPEEARYPPPDATASASSGQHTLHATPSGMGYPCHICHYGGMSTTMTASNQEGDAAIQIGFSGVAVSGMSDGTDTSYDGQTLANGYTYQGVNNTTVTTGGGIVCANTYCHSDGTSISTGFVSPEVGINTSPKWDGSSPDPQGDGNNCNNCHGYPPAYGNFVGGSKSNTHERHESIGFDCEICHYATTTDGVTITDATKHINGVYDVVASPTFLKNSIPYDSTLDYTFNGGAGRCSNISCHGVYGFGASFNWGGASLTPAGFSYDLTDQGDYGISIITGSPSCFPASACVSPYTYTWEFYDGLAASGSVVYTEQDFGTSSSVSYEYGAAGTYQAVVSVTGANGLTGEKTTISFTPSAPPPPPPAWYPDVSISGSTVTVSVNGDPYGKVYVYWPSGSDSFTSPTGSVQHTYSAGTYEIWLKIYAPDYSIHELYWDSWADQDDCDTCYTLKVTIP